LLNSPPHAVIALRRTSCGTALRRSAARDFRRAGVSEGEIMKLCGWRTRAMFDRYNVIDEQDLAAAVAKRFANDTVKRQSSPSTGSSPTLSSSAS
jgi:hypothetical protein